MSDKRRAPSGLSQSPEKRISARAVSADFSSSSLRLAEEPRQQQHQQQRSQQHEQRGQEQQQLQPLSSLQQQTPAALQQHPSSPPPLRALHADPALNAELLKEEAALYFLMDVAAHDLDAKRWMSEFIRDNKDGLALLLQEVQQRM